MSYLIHLVPWYVWLVGLLCIGTLFIPGVGVVVLGLLRTARAAWVILPDRVKVVIGAIAGLSLLILLHFWDIRAKVMAAEDRCDERWKAKLSAQKDAYDKQVAALKTKQQEVVTRTVIEYRDRIKIVKEKGDDIVKEIEVLVPLNSPLLAGGVRVAHDSAASGDLPNDPAGAASAAAPVEAATLLSGVAKNYTDCRAEYQKLVSLQSLVKNLEGVKP